MAEESTTLWLRARAFARTPEFARLCRYATVSVITTVLSLGLLYVFFDIVKLSSTDANIVATVISTVPAYYLTRNWTWGKSGKSHLMREVIPFWVIAAVGLVLSTIAVKLADAEARHLTHSHLIDTVCVLAANLLTYGVIWVVKFILFNKVLFVTRVEGGDPEPVLVGSNEAH